MSDDGGKVINLFADGDDGGEALHKWWKRLRPYLDEQQLVERARRVSPPAPPWPGKDNPMLAYVIERAKEIADSDGDADAFLWLGTHAWFEGGLDERLRTWRKLMDAT